MSFPRVSPTEPLDSRFFSRSSPSFLGSRSMVSFEDANAVNNTKRPFFSSFNQDEVVAGDEYEEYLTQPEKKRRLTADQIQFLEKSFETDNKLEPERKVQLAKDLGLQPRQVAIWFQNRRARWKNKQMEKDYDVLLSSYNSLKADYERILNEKEKLSAEVLDLNDKLGLLKKDLDQSDKEQPPKSSSPQGPTDESASEDEASKNQPEAHKLEDTSSKANDSDSSNYIDVGHFSLLEAGKTSYVLEPEHSDLSQDEEDNLSKNMVSPSVYVFPKMEDDEPAFSCYYEFPVEDQALDFWHY